MTSRLDRLFVLLEAGAGAATRRAAARQLGEVQKAHPEELHRLLGRLMKHLRSPAWETRIAATQAVEAILSNVPEWHPSSITVKKEEKQECDDTGKLLRCETFDIERVLKNGALLMGSEGQEYDVDEEALSSADLKKRLAQQRQLLNARLGVDVASKFGVDLSSMYSNEDLLIEKTPTCKTETARRPVEELVQTASAKPLSSREMNLAKRKARQAAFCKQKSRDCSDEGPSTPTTPTAPDEPERKKIKIEVTEDFNIYDSTAPTPDSTGSWGEAGAWPLRGWCGALQAQLFSVAWEARHGAASALRELLRAPVALSAGHRAGDTPQQMEDAHQEWLEDMALRLLCVLALDRFGDFVSDQVVAPVRETCAQTLGVCLAQLREARVRRVAALLAALARQPQWEARHGALLGFKYLLAARQEVGCSCGALEHLIAGLDDCAEDVSAVAAGALAPAAAALAAGRAGAGGGTGGAGALRAVAARAWRLLRDQDDLAAPANAYMALLAAIMALPQAATLLHPIDLSEVLPHLWPYLDHSSTSVRKATLQTLRTLTRPLLTSEPPRNGMTDINGDAKQPGANGDASDRGTVDGGKGDSSTGSDGGKGDSSMALDGGKGHSSMGSDGGNGDSSMGSDGEKGDSSMGSDGGNGDSSMGSDGEKGDSSMVLDGGKGHSSMGSDGGNDDSSMASNGEKYDSGTGANGGATLMWTPQLLQDAMRYIYQRVLFEHVHEIQEIALQVWENLLRHAPLGAILVAACPMLATWLCLAMQPARLCVDPALLLHPPPKERRTRSSSQGSEALPAAVVAAAAAAVRPAQKWLVGGGESQPAAQRDRNVMRARCLAADALGHLSCYLVQPAPGIEYKSEAESPIHCYVKVMVVHLRSGSALQRLVAGLVVASWARRTRLQPRPAHAHAHLAADSTDAAATMANGDSGSHEASDGAAPASLTGALHSALMQALYYDEVALNCNRLLQEARDLLAMMKHYKLPIEGEDFSHIVRLEQVLAMTSATEPLVAGMKVKRVQQSLEERRRSLHAAALQCCGEQAALNVAVQAALACACACLQSLPAKLNPVVRPLMESVKREGSEELQAHSARTLAALLAQLAGREPCPNNKVLVNLKAFLRCDPEHTPRVALPEKGDENGDSGSGESGAERDAPAPPPGPAPACQLDKYNGILTLWEQQRAVERSAPRRGRPPAAAAAAAAQPDLPMEQLFPHEDEARKQLWIQRRGATLALTSLTQHFGDELPEKLPKLWEFITEPLERVMTDSELESMECEAAEELISRLQVVEVVCGALGEALWACVVPLAPAAAALARAPHTAVRHMAARCLAALAARDPHRVMRTVIDEVVVSLGAAHSSVRVRCGAAETLARVVDALQLQVVPYIVLLVVPLLGRMSDQCEAVRLMSTRCFASLVRLMPLDGARDEPAALPAELRARRSHDKRFLERLFNPATIEDYKIPVHVSTELRSYQQAGVNWLRFLYEYKLHGVLCDDMGLGKTLQSIVVVAGSHWERAQLAAPPLPSLVVCPPTLTGHWVFEVNKFIPSQFLKPLQYVGPPAERERLRSYVKHYNLIVASYDIVRKDVDFFSRIKWNYCVLDEGHVIKNGKTKAFKAIKMITANHRLILSGTPIQNNVLELWSLFDFLMPGLLGTERQFTARYSRPILAARDPKATPHQLQAGALACEALHRQVLPFLLRRVKEDVLKELPPKITQDYYCELSPLQRRLYEHFSKSHMPQEIGSNQTHVFQALHYLQNVCNHPKLVLTAEHPEAARVAQHLAAQRSSLDDIEHSAKLPALKQLLLDCGIGASDASPSGAGVGVDVGAGVVSQHRALIFCQLKRMLDIVERDLLARHLPAVTYLRLDGSVPPHQRHAIVTRFNRDVSIDVLLLTTAVGGLGLNLTGADTVIFVEHDWNPMKDLQAMDRAHRIGQKKVVNVYRLITRDTLEEKIMGLQKFKLMTANTVISSENAALETMGTDQLLDLFQLSSAGGGAPAGAGAGVGAGAGPAGGGVPGAPALDALPDLWDDKQYEEEYDMSNFIKSLNKINA